MGEKPGLMKAITKKFAYIYIYIYMDKVMFIRHKYRKS